MAFILINFILIAIFNSNPKSPQDFIWKNRILIIQDNESDLRWFQQDLKKNLNDRKLLIFQFKGGQLERSTSEHQIKTEDFLELLESKNSKHNAWILIGLDGGVKNFGEKRPLPKEIFKIIDAMPMRQSEIKKFNR